MKLLGLFICLLVLVGVSLSAPAQVTPLPAVAPAAFPLRVSENGRHLVDADGRPFLVIGDAAWSLVAQLNEENIARLGKFFTALPWQQLVPDTEGKLVAAGAGDAAARITAARALDGSLAVLYIPADGEGPRELKLNLASFAGPVTARWFNPAKDASLLPYGAALPNREQQTLETPGDNGTSANDWILILESR
ncbi:MAG: putative collagen-binding domain-containing protein [Verrucomicrobiota bacterium]|jgi:hypothetical protein